MPTIQATLDEERLLVVVAATTSTCLFLPYHVPPLSLARTHPATQTRPTLPPSHAAASYSLWTHVCHVTYMWTDDRVRICSLDLINGTFAGSPVRRNPISFFR